MNPSASLEAHHYKLMKLPVVPLYITPDPHTGKNVLFILLLFFIALLHFYVSLDKSCLALLAVHTSLLGVS